MLDPNRHKFEIAIVIKTEGTSSVVVASVSADDLAELIAINREMVVGGVGVFTRKSGRLEALIQRITAVMPVEDVSAA